MLSSSPHGCIDGELHFMDPGNAERKPLPVAVYIEGKKGRRGKGEKGVGVG